jgi:hypothetical protein
MQVSTPLGNPSAMQRIRRMFGRELIAWSVIALIAVATIFIQSCPDHANAEEQGATWSDSSPWAAIYNCPIHQAFILPLGDQQGS